MIWLVMLACAGSKDTAEEEGVEIHGDLLSVSESASGRLLFIHPKTGTFRGEVCLEEALPLQCAVGEDEGCLLFAAEHALVDGQSTFQLTYARRGPDIAHAPSGVISVTPTHPPEIRWKLTTLTFPTEAENTRCAAISPPDCVLSGTHIVIEDGDDTLIAADTNNSRVLWLSPQGDGEGLVTAVLDDSHPDWDGWRNVNHVQRIDDGDRALLLTTFKASRIENGGLTDRGRIVLWDVTDPAAPERLWAWPEDGDLAAVHHGIVQETAAGTLLLYAHSLGASDNPDTGVLGSIGFARYNGPDQPPTYLADGVLPEDKHPLGFVREAESFAPLDWLLITDSGCENASADCRYPGRLLSVRLPELEPEGQGGGLGDQRFVELEQIPDAERQQLTFPYEADLYYADEIDAALAAGVGACAE